MGSSKKGHRLTEYGHATVVQYDLTSSEEELEDDHSSVITHIVPQRTFPRCLLKARMRSTRKAPSSCQAAETVKAVGEDQAAHRTVPPPLIDLSSVDG